MRDVLTQAVLDAPMFGVYWRWNASTALAVRRFRNGKKQPAQFQRMDAEDLLSTVFPDQLACAENLAGGDREIPDHPLVKQTLEDCLTAAMDVDGLVEVLERIEAGEIEVICRELTSPSPLAQEILGAKPYAFLDDAPAEERRTLAVQSRRYMTPEQAAELGKLDPEAIERVRERSVAAAAERRRAARRARAARLRDGRRRRARGRALFERLRADGRATTVELPRRGTVWVARSGLPEVDARVSGRRRRRAARRARRRRRRSRHGAARARAQPLRGARPRDGRSAGAAVRPRRAATCCRRSLALEQQGTAMRGNFTAAARAARSGASGACSRASIATR